jgi:hypothetical protein
VPNPKPPRHVRHEREAWAGRVRVAHGYHPLRVQSIRTWCWCLRWGLWGSGRSGQSFFANTVRTSFFASLSPIFSAVTGVVPNHPCCTLRCHACVGRRLFR